MIPKRWSEVKERLQVALDLELPERASYLEELGASDPELRREIESLLVSHDQAGASDFLNAAGFADEEETITLPSMIGRRVGSYQIVEQIGVGGMGEVYRAVRADDQYQKQVAVKIVRTGPESSFVVSRFRNERQILASLDHPNIARLVDGGTTDEGVPYFVMELIEGQPIDEYCDHHRLSTTGRLALFRMVCSAVQYAHQHLIIHRDIKPGNVLVTAEGVPKLLDFGIAKILNAEGGERAQATLPVFGALTPGYASPEQIKGEAITTASDVYSLGVVLYELLTGHRPYRITRRSPQEITRAVCEVEPERPSTVVNRSEDKEDNSERTAITPAAVSAVRDGSPEKLSRRLGGDLDNIVMMALRKEPERRYASVDLFSEDIRRHLENLPVIARTDSVGYRAAKFVRRHRVGVVATAAILALLVVGIAITAREARIARAERARAERRFNDVRALSNTLLFQIDDSMRDIPGTTEAQHLLISSAQKYLDSLSQEAGGDLSLLRELAAGYDRLGEIQGSSRAPSLGDTRSAIESYRKEISLREAIAKAAPADDQARHELQNAYDAIGHLLLGTDTAQAESNFQKSMSLAIPLAKNNPANPDFLFSLALAYEHQAMLCTHKHDDDGARVNQEESLKLAEQLVAVAPTERNRTLLSYGHKRVGGLLILAGKLPEALVEYQAALAIDEDLLGKHADDPKLRFGITYTYSDIGYIYWHQKNYAVALDRYQKALAIRQALADADPKNAQAGLGIARSSGYLGAILREQGKPRAALPYDQRQNSIFAEQYSRNANSGSLRISLAESEWDLGKDYAGIAGQVSARPEKLHYLRLARPLLQQALAAVSDPKTRGFLVGDQINDPTAIAADLAKCNEALKRVEGN